MSNGLATMDFFGQQDAAELGEPVGSESELDSRETQRPLRVPFACENSGPDAEASFDDQARVDGVPALVRLAQTAPKPRRGVSGTPPLRELRMPLEVCVHIVVWKEGEDREPRRRDAQGKAHTLGQYEGSDGKAPLLAQQTHCLVAASH